jgi:hypothetical protein
MGTHEPRVNARLTRRLARWPFIAAGAWFLAYAVLAVTMPMHREQAPEPAAVATIVVVGAQAHQAAMDNQLAALMTARHCTPPSLWKATHGSQVPASMLLKRDNTFTLSAVAWTYPAPAGYWTMALCTR